MTNRLPPHGKASVTEPGKGVVAYAVVQVPPCDRAALTALAYETGLITPERTE